MTPAELKARIDAALEAQPGVMLAPASVDAMQSGHKCVLGFLCQSPYPCTLSEFKTSGLDSCTAKELLYGFEADRMLRGEYWDLGYSYRSHPRCILTQGAKP